MVEVLALEELEQLTLLRNRVSASQKNFELHVNNF